MEFWLYTVLILALTTVGVIGRSSGAPDQACDNGLVPDHGGTNTASGDVPFIVNTSNIGSSYTPDAMYTIVLSGGNTNPNFRGFIIQARMRADGTPVGTFVDEANDNDYQLQCDGNTATTHVNGNQKTAVTLMWTAPPTGTGPIIFRYAFVDQFSSGINIFWAQLETSVIVEEVPFMMFDQSMYSVNEDAGSVLPVLVINSSLPSNFTVEVYNTDGTAAGGDVDYTSGPYSVTFPANVTRVEFSISINNDTLFENNENFTLSINSSSLPTGVMVGDPGEATVTIVDDDAITVMFNQSMYIVDEDAGQVSPILVINRLSLNNITVEVTNTDGSATGGGVDYTSGPYSVTIPAGETSVEFDISINNDTEFENFENFTLTITSSSLPTGVMVGDPGQATVTIVDDDTTFVMFDQATYSVDEDAGPVQPVLVASKSFLNNVTVEVYNTDGSATGGDVDYISGPYSVTFPAGMMRAEFSISIINDTVFEGNEDFMLVINSSLPTDIRVGYPDQVTVTIVDDDPITVMFSQPMYSVDEDDGPVSPVLVISNPSSTDITVQVNSTDGSAEGGGVDYTSGPYSVTFPAGITNVTFNIQIINDNMVENNETFTLAIDSSSLPTGIMVDSPRQATVTIINDDAEGTSSGATGAAAASLVMILLLISIITLAI